MHTNNSISRTSSTPQVPGLPEMALAGGMKLEKWRRAVGISRTAAWRLRKTGKLQVIVRYNQVYVTADTIRNFFTNDGTKPRAFASN